ncbi:MULTISPECIES: hypothetical protein [unclassified Hwanghaeella]|uniref:hypothetical protein n=1 Tax=unclassified Hwanghaeella TaxID=2605944 RepID=UPI000C92FA47|nr:hypothetical protein [Rhodospirillales bacterium]
MSDFGSGIGTRIQPRPQEGIGGGVGLTRPGAGRSGNSDASPGDGRSVDSTSVLEGAFNRLRTLLAFDGDKGPREGVRRGFYLNIVV